MAYIWSLLVFVVFFLILCEPNSCVRMSLVIIMIIRRSKREWKVGKSQSSRHHLTSILLLSLFSLSPTHGELSTMRSNSIIIRQGNTVGSLHHKEQKSGVKERIPFDNRGSIVCVYAVVNE